MLSKKSLRVKTIELNIDGQLVKFNVSYDSKVNIWEMKEVNSGSSVTWCRRFVELARLEINSGE